MGHAGGETVIRTLGGLAPTTVFETAPFDHSGTSPRGSRPPNAGQSQAQGAICADRELGALGLRYAAAPAYPWHRNASAEGSGCSARSH